MRETYLESSWTTIIELFCENSSWLQGAGECCILLYFIYTSYMHMN